MDRTHANGSFDRAKVGFWNAAGSPDGWKSTDPTRTYTATIGFVQVLSGVTVLRSTGQRAEAGAQYLLQADLGGDEGSIAKVSLIATQRPDGSGRSEEIVHIVGRGKPRYQLTTVSGLSEPLPEDFARYTLHVELTAPRAGRGAFDNIVVRSQHAAPITTPATSEIIAAAGPPAASTNGDFLLAHHGKPIATIVLSRTPTLASAYAAKELQEHVQKITGATLPLVTDRAEVPGPRILIGQSEATKKYGLKGSDFQHREHLIGFKDHTLILLGRDDEKPFRIGYPADVSWVPLPGWFEDRGTLNAVYDFLELYCGVRWYHAGDLGTVCPTQPTLVIARKDLRRKSDMLSIRGYFHATYFLPGDREPIPGDAVDVWRLRMRMGGHPVHIDHSLYEYWKRFGASHPDWFAKGYDNFRQPPQPCYTNPEFIRQVAQDACDYFDGKFCFHEFPLVQLPPGSDFFPVVPNDDMRWCQCPRCRAEFDVDSKQVVTSPGFSSSEASNYIWGFINKVAAEVRKTHPGKYIAGLSYQQFAGYPTRVKLEPNVAVMFCLWNQRGWHVPKLAQVERNVLLDWARLGGPRPKFIWAYYMNPTASAIDAWRPFPCYFAHEAVRQMRLFHDLGVQGIWVAQSSEMGWSHWYDIPDLYLTLRLAENAGLDGNRMLDEFFERYYGASAEPMKQLYLSLEDTYTNPQNYPAEWLDRPNVRITEEIAWGRLGTPERMRHWAELISQAQARAATALEKERVEQFVKGIWKSMTAGAAEHALIAERKNESFEVRVPKSTTGYGGDPAKVDWSQGVDIGPLSSFAGIPNPIGRPIEIRMIHDGAWLYLQSLERCDPKKLSSGTPFGADSFTDPMFFDSLVFMAAKGIHPSRQIHVIGAQGSERIRWEGSGNATDDWKKAWRAVSDKTLPDRWRVWIAIPLTEVIAGGARSGDRFQANIYRYCVAPMPLAGWLVWRPPFESGYPSRDVRKMGTIRLD